MENLYKSLTVNERYHVISRSKELLPKSQNISIWRSLMTVTSITDFENMLKYYGYDRELFGLAVDYEPNKDLLQKYQYYARNSDWYINFEKILKSNHFQLQIDKNKMSYILRNFIYYVEKEIYKQIDPEIKKIIEQSAMEELIQNYAISIVNYALRSLIVELNYARLNKILKGNNEKERFQSFIRLFDEENKIIEFFDKYIVLARSLTEISLLFINNVVELFNRLKRNKSDILYKFGVDDKNFQVCSCKFDLGDGHNGNKTVAIITFKNGKKIVYKPKNLEVNIKFNDLFTYINNSKELLNIKTTKTIVYDNYGYEEFIPHIKCETEEELERYYIRFGYILCLSYVFNVTDLHMENIIAFGEYPLIIDLETAFQQPMTNIFSNNNKYYKTVEMLFDTIDRTALMNAKLSVGTNEQKIEIGALNGIELEMEDILDIINEETDKMRLQKTTVKVPGSNNIPYKNEKSNLYREYYNNIIAGFRDMYNYLMKAVHVPEFVSVTQGFKNVKLRLIIRDTNMYATILNNTYHPDLLQNMLDREKVFENLWALTIDNNDVINSEICALRNNDIPYFHFIGNEMPYYDNHCELGKFIKTTGYNYFIEGFCKKDLERQVSLINLHFNKFYLPKKINEYQYKINQIKELKIDSFDYTEIIFKVTNQILEESLLIENEHRVWMSIVSNDEGEYSYDLLGVDFYDGVCGYALLLYYVNKYNKKEVYRETYSQLIKQLKAMMEDNHDLYNEKIGYTSCFSLLHMISFLDDNELDKSIYKEIIRVSLINLNKIKENKILSDFLNGIPSLINSLVRLYEKTKEATIMNGVLLLTEKLYTMINEEINSDNHIEHIGYAHGYESIALTFYKVYEIVKVKKYLDIAQELNVYSTVLISKSDNNELKWCNGIVGAAIAQISIIQILNRLGINYEINEKLLNKLHDKILNSILIPNDCLCHGNAGVVEYLIQRYALVNIQEDYEMAKKLMIIQFKQYMQSGYFNVKQLKAIKNIGLFTGVSGILLEGLRTMNLKEVPSILI